MSSGELSGAVTTDDESVTSGQVILFNDIIDDLFFILNIVAHACSSTKFSAEGTLRQHAEEEPWSQAADEEGQKNSAEVMGCLKDNK